MFLNALSQINSNQFLQFNGVSNVKTVEKSNDFTNSSIKKIIDVAKIIHQADQEIANNSLNNNDLLLAYENVAKRYVHLKAKIENCNIFKQFWIKIIQVFSGYNLDKEFSKFENDTLERINLKAQSLQLIRKNIQMKKDFFIVGDIDKKDFKPLKNEGGEIPADPIFRVLGNQIEREWKKIQELTKMGKTFKDKDFLEIYDAYMLKVFCFSNYILKNEIPRVIPLFERQLEREAQAHKANIQKMLRQTSFNPTELYKELSQILENPKTEDEKIFKERLNKISQDQVDLEFLYELFIFKTEAKKSFLQFPDDLESLKNFPDLSSEGFYYASRVIELREFKINPYHELIYNQKTFLSWYSPVDYGRAYYECRKDKNLSEPFYQEGTLQANWRELYNLLYKEIEETMGANKNFLDERDRLFPGPDSSVEVWNKYTFLT